MIPLTQKVAILRSTKSSKKPELACTLMLGEVIEGSLTETEEECVHTHAKNTEEATGNDISSQDGGLEDTGLL